jgi:hypothetical protein
MSNPDDGYLSAKMTIGSRSARGTGIIFPCAKAVIYSDVQRKLSIRLIILSHVLMSAQSSNLFVDPVKSIAQIL